VGYAQVLDRPRQHEAVGRDDARLALVLDEAAGVEGLGVDDRVEGVDEDPPLGRGAQVVAEAGEPVADHALADQAVLERLDHPLLEGLLPYPAVGPDAHAGKSISAPPRRPGVVPSRARGRAVWPQSDIIRMSRWTRWVVYRRRALSSSTGSCCSWRRWPSVLAAAGWSAPP